MLDKSNKERGEEKLQCEELIKNLTEEKKKAEQELKSTLQEFDQWIDKTQKQVWAHNLAKLKEEAEDPTKNERDELLEEKKQWVEEKKAMKEEIKKLKHMVVDLVNAANGDKQKLKIIKDICNKED
jgi:FMN phosphatase YigB (HAD superfamily)